MRWEIDRLRSDPEIKRDPLFFLKNLELNLNVVVSKATETGIRFFVVTAGGKYKKEKISTVKMSFEPLALGPRDKKDLTTMITTG